MNTSSKEDESGSLLKICDEIINNSSFKEEYCLLYKIGVLCDLLSISLDEVKGVIKQELEANINLIGSSTISRLSESAFIFALLDSTNQLSDPESTKKIDDIKNKAYRIAIGLYSLWKYSNDAIWEKWGHAIFNNYDIIYRLFTRLGILTRARNDGLDWVNVFDLDLHWKIEAISKDSSNVFSISEFFKRKYSKEFKIPLRNYYLSDYQKAVLEKLLSGSRDDLSCAMSAPTSAGKTFIIKIYIILKILEAQLNNEQINIAFVIPTKALTNELKSDFVELFEEYWISEELCGLHSYTSSDDLLSSVSDRSNLFIVTQERLNYIQNEIEQKGGILRIHILVIDEAHKVWYGYRGTLLNYVVTKVRKNYASNQLILLAPLLSWLHRFKAEFNLEQIRENYSNFWMVGKNVISISSVKDWDVHVNTLLLNIWSDKIKLFDFQTPSSGVFNQKRKLAYFSRLFTNWSAQTIIYRYSPESVESQALEIYSLLSETEIADTDLSLYLKDILPNKFPLSSYLRKGVAYHSWKLPISVKTAIEKEFRDKNKISIRFLCANHTVLEWVNLPAKNIFICGKDLGKETLSELDLRNLIGRSGRLNEHLMGNVFFIQPSRDEEIPNDDSDLIQLTNNISNTLSDDDSWDSKFDRFLKYLEGDLYKASIAYASDNERYLKSREKKDFEYMAWYLVSGYLEKMLKSDSRSGGLVNLRSIIESYGHIGSYSLDSYVSGIGDLIYFSRVRREEKLQRLNDLLNSICKDLNEKSRCNYELFKIIQKNIFIDPRKQLDFYLDIESGKNAFVLNNIGKYSDAFSMLNSSKILLKRPHWITITTKLLLLWPLVQDVQKHFVQLFEDTNKRTTYYSGERWWKRTMLWKINQWISWVPVKNILGYSPKWYYEILHLLTEEVQFNYLNAFNVYLELANLGYEKHAELTWAHVEEAPSFDINFLYYLEIGGFFPNVVYMISKWVSRESALWLTSKNSGNDSPIVDIFPPSSQSERDYFNVNRSNITDKLISLNKRVVLSELNRFVFNQ